MKLCVCVCVCRDDLRQLTYLKYCIKESLRLYPPVSSHGRMLEKETEIDGRSFPAGTRVVIVPYAVHRCPDIWDNPEVIWDKTRSDPFGNGLVFILSPGV